MQRLDQVGHDGAIAGLDEGLDRHPGDELQAVQARDLLGRHGDAHDVKGGAALLVLGDIGRHHRHHPVNLGRGALVERREAQRRALAHRHLVDVLRRQLRLDGEPVGFRHDQHERLARLHHAADRVHGQLVHDAVLRGADVDAHELVLGGNPALHQLGDLALDLAQLLGHLAAEILIDLEDLQLDLGGLALGLGDVGDELAALAGQAGRLALKLHPTLDRDEPLVPKLADAFELFVNEINLGLLGLGLAGKTDDVVLELRDLFPELRLLAGAGLLPELEQDLLAVDDPGDVRVLPARQQIGGKIELLVVVALGFEPRLARGELVQAFDDDGEVGARGGVVEADDHVAALDAAAVANAQLADDSSGRVLDLLDVGFHDQDAGGDDRAREFSGCGPPAQAPGQQHDHGDRRQYVTADRTAGAAVQAVFAVYAVLAVLLVHAGLAPPSGTTII